MPKHTHIVLDRFSRGQNLTNPFEYLRRYMANGQYKTGTKFMREQQFLRINYFDHRLYHYAAAFWKPFDVDIEVNHVWCKYMSRVFKNPGNKQKQPFWFLIVEDPQFSFAHFKAWCVEHGATIAFNNNDVITRDQLDPLVDYWGTINCKIEDHSQLIDKKIDNRSEIVYK